MRAATYDHQIRDWISETLGKLICLNKQSNGFLFAFLSVCAGTVDFTEESVDLSPLGKYLIDKNNLPDLEPVQLTVTDLLREGQRLATEQQRINDSKLSQEYLRFMKGDGTSIIGFGS